jgi:hypothetical protein
MRRAEGWLRHLELTVVAAVGLLVLIAYLVSQTSCWS